MDTAFLHTLLLVIEDGSISAAARRLGLTPGAVALRVRTVEAELGTPLVRRAGRAVTPLPAAMRLLAPMREVIALTGQLRGLAKDDGIAGELRLGSIATANTGIVPLLLSDLTRTHPALELRIEPGTSIDLCRRVRDGALDAAVVVEPPFPVGKAEAFTAWFDEPLVLIAPPDTLGCDPMALLSSERFIRYDRGSWGGRVVDDWLRRHAARIDDWIELDALDGIVAMVAAGLGVSVIPDWSGPRPAGRKVLSLPLPGPVPARVIGLYARRLSPRQDLIALLQSSFERFAKNARGPGRSRRAGST